MDPGAPRGMLRAERRPGAAGGAAPSTRLWAVPPSVWPQEPCSKGMRRGKSDVQWRGGGCRFPWVEDYRSLRRFCVLGARGALLGLLEAALAGLVLLYIYI